MIGIEWLNDTTLLLLFPSPSATLLGLTLLSKAGFDPSEGDDPLLERAAHSVPLSLLPMNEPDPADSLAGSELIPNIASEGNSQKILKRGRGTFGGSSKSGVFDLEPLVSPRDSDLAPDVDPKARIAVRYATEADTELRRQAKQSEWYARHGRQAGKEVAGDPRTGQRGADERVSWNGGGTGEGREFAKRIGRERRADPYARPGARRSERDLDKELEGMARLRDNVGMEVDEDGCGLDEREVRGVMTVGRQRGRGRESRGKVDLDRGEPECIWRL